MRTSTSGLELGFMHSCFMLDSNIVRMSYTNLVFKKKKKKGKGKGINWKWNMKSEIMDITG